jgi:hypothetical protein
MKRSVYGSIFAQFDQMRYRFRQGAALCPLPGGAGSFQASRNFAKALHAETQSRGDIRRTAWSPGQRPAPLNVWRALRQNK